MFADLHIYFGVAVAGLVSFLSPCVLPLVPPYLGYIGGTTFDQLTGDEGIDREVWKRVVISAIVFVLGFTTVFVGLGATASTLGQVLQSYRAGLGTVAGVIITLFGLHFLGVLRIPLLYKEARFEAGGSGASLAGAYVMGLAFAFGWTPCIGPILATVLTLAAQENSLSAGIAMLFVYSLGLGIPFILAAVAIRPFLGFMKKFRKHFDLLEKAMGVLLLLTGALFVAGTVREGLQLVIPGVPERAGLVGILLVVTGVALVLQTRKWCGLVGAIAVIAGTALLGGSMNSAGNWIIENFPGLTAIEAWLTPDSLRGEILKKSGG